MKPIIHQFSAWLRLVDKHGAPMSEADLELSLAAMCVLSGHTILDISRHGFEPQGLTTLWLLAESHLALHTWPEDGVAYVQLSSCSEEKAAEFIRIMHKKYQARMVVVDNSINAPSQLLG